MFRLLSLLAIAAAPFVSAVSCPSLAVGAPFTGLSGALQVYTTQYVSSMGSSSSDTNCSPVLSPATAGLYTWNLDFSVFNTERDPSCTTTSPCDYLTINKRTTVGGTWTKVVSLAGLPTQSQYDLAKNIQARELQLVWKSDSSVAYTSTNGYVGWKMTYTATPTTTGPTTTTAPTTTAGPTTTVSPATTKPPTSSPTTTPNVNNNLPWCVPVSGKVQGSTTITGNPNTTGVLGVTGSAYVVNMACTATIVAPADTIMGINLKFEAFNTESGYDFVTITKTTATGTTQVIKVSGTSITSAQATLIQNIIATKLVISWVSDTAVVGTGWRLTWKTNIMATTAISSLSQFVDMTNNAGFVAGRSLKYLIDVRQGWTACKAYFMNMNYRVNGATPSENEYHQDFAAAILPLPAVDLNAFNSQTYFSQTKLYVAGTIQEYKLSGDIIYGIQLYPEDAAQNITITRIMTCLLKPTTTTTVATSPLRLAGAKFHFVATGPQQIIKPSDQTAIQAIRSPYTDYDTIDTVLGGITFIPMQLGICYGYIRMFPNSTIQPFLTPLDIPVFDQLPLALAVVAGTITVSYQDTNAHVNLKSKERGTPNMVLRDASPTNTLLQPWIDQPVRLEITANSWTITASTPDEVEFKNRRTGPWIPVQWVSDTRILKLQDMCPANFLTTTSQPTATQIATMRTCLDLGKAYGTKSSNLGFLMSAPVLGRASIPGSLAASTSKGFGYDIVADGFALPIQFYHDMVNHPNNTALKTALDILIQSELSNNATVSSRLTQSATVRKLFLKSYIDPTIVNKVITNIWEMFTPDLEEGQYKVKIRSSANAEDLANFDGAGLHDSFSANTNKTDNPDFSCKVVDGGDGVETKLDVKPKTVQCAIKAVYASLWNDRAIAERTYARLDHSTVGMGIGVVSKYDSESDVIANSVVVSRAVASPQTLGYTFSNQVGNNLVTNPTPGTTTEQILAGFSGEEANTYTVLQYAQPNASEPFLTHPVYTYAQSEQLLSIVQKTEIAYCWYKGISYTGGSSGSSNCNYVIYDTKKAKALDMEFKYLANGKWVSKQLREFGGYAPEQQTILAAISSLPQDEGEDLILPPKEESTLTAGSVSIGMVVGIVVGVSVLLAIVASVVIRQRQHTSKMSAMVQHTTSTSTSNDVEMNNYMANPAIDSRV